MNKSQVPRGFKMRDKCKCGRNFHPRLFGSSMKTTKECSICNPEAYKDAKKK